MTFQRRTALKIVELVRTRKPGVRVVVGGYDPSLASTAYTGPDSGVDYNHEDLVDAMWRNLSAAAFLQDRNTLAIGAAAAARIER